MLENKLAELKDSDDDSDDDNILANRSASNVQNLSLTQE